MKVFPRITVRLPPEVVPDKYMQEEVPFPKKSFPVILLFLDTEDDSGGRRATFVVLKTESAISESFIFADMNSIPPGLLVPPITIVEFAIVRFEIEPPPIIPVREVNSSFAEKIVTLCTKAFNPEYSVRMESSEPPVRFISNRLSLIVRLEIG